MRKKIHTNSRVIYISTLILLFILLFSNITLAQGKQLEIIITNLSNEEIIEIYEEESFKVSVLDPESEEPTPFLADVTIEFNDLYYQINDTRELILQAPEVDQDTSLTLKASKIGYNSTNFSINILNKDAKKLDIIPLDGWTVDAGQKFSVMVVDEQGNYVNDAYVAVKNFGETKKTKDKGIATLITPSDEESIGIIAQKDGYEQKEISLEVNIVPPWWIEFINSQYFPIVIAVIFLLFAIVYVNNRQKKSIYSRTKEISDEKNLKKYDSGGKTTSLHEDKEIIENKSSIEEPVRIQPQQDAKVEEIRISKPRKEKEIIPVKSEDDETEKIISRKKTQKRDYDWFEGTDNIRYEIDKLTGEVDEKGADKWYEGVDTLKEKIDEKVKKRDKKKDK